MKFSKEVLAQDLGHFGLVTSWPSQLAGCTPTLVDTPPLMSFLLCRFTRLNRQSSFLSYATVLMRTLHAPALAQRLICRSMEVTVSHVFASLLDIARIGWVAIIPRCAGAMPKF